MLLLEGILDLNIGDAACALSVGMHGLLFVVVKLQDGFVRLVCRKRSKQLLVGDMVPTSLDETCKFARLV